MTPPAFCRSRFWVRRDERLGNLSPLKAGLKSTLLQPSTEHRRFLGSRSSHPLGSGIERLIPVPVPASRYFALREPIRPFSSLQERGRPCRNPLPLHSDAYNILHASVTGVHPSWLQVHQVVRGCGWKTPRCADFPFRAHRNSQAAAHNAQSSFAHQALARPVLDLNSPRN